MGQIVGRSASRRSQVGGRQVGGQWSAGAVSVSVVEARQRGRHGSGRQGQASGSAGSQVPGLAKPPRRVRGRVECALGGSSEAQSLGTTNPKVSTRNSSSRQGSDCELATADRESRELARVTPEREETMRSEPADEPIATTGRAVS